MWLATQKPLSRLSQRPGNQDDADDRQQHQQPPAKRLLVHPILGLQTGEETEHGKEHHLQRQRERIPVEKIPGRHRD
jgi:hypothetical protein